MSQATAPRKGAKTREPGFVGGWTRGRGGRGILEGQRSSRRREGWFRARAALAISRSRAVTWKVVRPRRGTARGHGNEGGYLMRRGDKMVAGGGCTSDLGLHGPVSDPER